MVANPVTMAARAWNAAPPVLVGNVRVRPSAPMDVKTSGTARTTDVAANAATAKMGNVMMKEHAKLDAKTLSTVPNVKSTVQRRVKMIHVIRSAASVQTVALHQLDPFAEILVYFI